jgi:predicted NAD-dependent protein-ADP-ribosyltransferase YbiA (DUF1768 family)
MITQFRGPYRFLSSFAEIPCTVPWFDGWTAPTREHAYQACKAASWEEARFVLSAPRPGEAKRRGREIRAWPDWDARRRSVMLTLALGQFAQPGPRALLAATAGHVLVEGNTWGDVYWGAVPVTSGTIYPGGNGPPPLWKPDGADPQTWLCGDNWLGRVLMMTRDVIS